MAIKTKQQGVAKRTSAETRLHNQHVTAWEASREKCRCGCITFWRKGLMTKCTECGGITEFGFDYVIARKTLEHTFPKIRSGEEAKQAEAI